MPPAEAAKDAPALKPGDKVLVRDNTRMSWTVNTFKHYKPDDRHPYYCAVYNWRYCIPYAGNEHLAHTQGPGGVEKYHPKRYRKARCCGTCGARRLTRYDYLFCEAHKTYVLADHICDTYEDGSSNE